MVIHFRKIFFRKCITMDKISHDFLSKAPEEPVNKENEGLFE
jgi:hypothetical protein